MGMRKSYGMLAVIYLSGIAGPLNQFKVPPVMHQLMKSMDISIAGAGMVMSVFALVGFVCAIPAGIILRYFSIKVVGVLGLGVMLTGSLLGGMAESPGLLLASRAFEGAGMCVMSVIAPTAITAWFPPDKRGMPTGVWGTWISMGSIIVYAAAPFLADAGQWQDVWKLSSAYTAFAFVIFLAFFRMPEGCGANGSAGCRGEVAVNAVRNIGLLGLTCMFFTIIIISLKSFLPLFLLNERGYSSAGASNAVNIMIIVSIFSGPLMGIISDKVGSRRKVLIVGCIIMCFASAVPFLAVSHILIAAGLFVIGIAFGHILPIILAAAAEAGGPSNAATGLSIVSFCQYLGMMAGPVFFSAVVNAGGWNAAGLVLIPVAAASCVTAFFIKVK